MFQADKDNLFELLASMSEMHKVVSDSKDIKKRNEYLMDCQQAAITIGETLEEQEKQHQKLYPKMADIVKVLEQYCEEIYQISQNNDARINRQVKHLEKKLVSVRRELRKLPVRQRIVFLPYKADMWDSLESIYLAAKEDVRCEAIVCPIPYYEKDAIKDEWVFKYEGTRFPHEIPITYFEQLDLSATKVDAAYIHNPYDNYNLVTAVHPKYYSDELKKHVRKLIYVPYYMDGAVFSVNLRGLPVMQNADWIVMASDYMKEGCRQESFYPKILPFGSPKFDRLIRLDREEKSIPDEWKWALEDKKVLLLNTSINELLEMNDLLLKKLEVVFNLIRENDSLALIWRPHPLLESTIRAMRPGLMEEYQSLIRYYMDEKIGIYDTTSDADRSAILSDGYIGSRYSSIIRLFEVLGKPVYRFSYTYEEPGMVHMSDSEIKEMLDTGFYSHWEGDYFSMLEENGLPLEVYIRGFCDFDFTGTREKELACVAQYANNLDGSIGSRVHEFVMKDLGEVD